MESTFLAYAAQKALLATSTVYPAQGRSDAP